MSAFLRHARSTSSEPINRWGYSVSGSTKASTAVGRHLEGKIFGDGCMYGSAALVFAVYWSIRFRVMARAGGQN